MYDALHIEHKKKAVYHPQCNGQDENTNKNIKRLELLNQTYIVALMKKIHKAKTYII